MHRIEMHRNAIEMNRNSLFIEYSLVGKVLNLGYSIKMPPTLLSFINLFISPTSFRVP